MQPTSNLHNQTLHGILRAGIALGLLLSAWFFVMAFSGWYRSPRTFWLAVVSIVLHAAGLVVLMHKRQIKRGYAQRVELGVMTSAVAAVVVFVGVLLLTSVVLPHYFDDLRWAQQQVMTARGDDPVHIEETLRAARATQSPAAQAMAALMSTMATGFLLSLVIAARGPGGKSLSPSA